MNIDYETLRKSYFFAITGRYKQKLFALINEHGLNRMSVC